MNTADTIRELMSHYNERRAEWVEKLSTDEGFNEWFTKQVIGNE